MNVDGGIHVKHQERSDVTANWQLRGTKIGTLKKRSVYKKIKSKQ